jgi:hypothetical protein
VDQFTGSGHDDHPSSRRDGELHDYLTLGLLAGRRPCAIPAISASPLPHLDRCVAVHREEYGGNDYGGLPVPDDASGSPDDAEAEVRYAWCLEYAFEFKLRLPRVETVE